MASSLINNIVTPDSTAQALTHEDLARTVTQLVLRQTMFFTSVAERTAVLANVLAVHGLAPPAGAISHISTLARYDRYDGTNWLPFMLTDDFSGLADPWVVWTPTLTNLTLGNGVVTAKRRLVGKTLDFRFKFVLGSTSAVGTNPQFTLSHAPHANYVQFDVLGRGTLLDAGTASTDSIGRFDTGSTVSILHQSAANLHASITATVPWTWTTGDMLTVHGTFETA